MLRGPQGARRRTRACGVGSGEAGDAHANGDQACPEEPILRGNEEEAGCNNNTVIRSTADDGINPAFRQALLISRCVGDFLLRRLRSRLAGRLAASCILGWTECRESVCGHRSPAEHFQEPICRCPARRDGQGNRCARIAAGHFLALLLDPTDCRRKTLLCQHCLDQFWNVAGQLQVALVVHTAPTFLCRVRLHIPFALEVIKVTLSVVVKEEKQDALVPVGVVLDVVCVPEARSGPH
mmetsp:Transcript_87799/g.253181  ORF Transcript_87799/g.253181 Transcript_87799/m.253181 type:complete len:238 (-) Transcript_87799:520-1233(-)